MFKEKSVNDFIEELASSSPVPGGGSVGALSASLAAALNSMVLNLTVGKKIYEAYDENQKEKVLETLKYSEKEMRDFLFLINKDMEEFNNLMGTFKLPKSNEEEKEYRDRKLQEGYEKALEVPLLVAEKSLELYDYILTSCDLGNKNLISDVGVAAITLNGAMETSVLNVRINLKSLKNQDKKKEIENICCDLLRLSGEKKEQIMALVYKLI